MIYICIPVHNEERTIGVLLWKIRQVMADFGRDYRILVLDDGSTDGTGQVVERYRRVLPLSVLRERLRTGYATSLERLLKEAAELSSYAKRDAVLTLQGDFTESPEVIVPLLKAFEGGADLVSGWRRGDDGSVPGRVRLARWMVPVLLGRALEGVPVSDSTCGLRVFRVVVLKKALRETDGQRLLTGDGLAANAELLARTAPHARRIAEVGFRVRHDVRQRKSRLRLIPTVRSLIRVRGSLARAGGSGELA